MDEDIRKDTRAFKGIEYNDLRDVLLSITNEEHQALLMLTYAVLGRIGEVVNRRYRKYREVGICYSDFATKITPVGTRLLEIKVIREKSPGGKESRVIINRDKEAWLTSPLLKYAKQHKVDGRLFNYSTRWAEKIFEIYFGKKFLDYNYKFGQHIHLMRGWRYTHLKIGAPDGIKHSEGFLARSGGWSDSVTPQRLYDSSVIEDYYDEMK